MNPVDRLRRAFRNPRLFVRGLNRLFHRRGGCRSENTDGIDVFDEDWDTLILLDACRYDMFESTSHLDGTLCLKESKGSSTSEWLRANVDGRDLLDTVYVTANPQLERNRDTWDVNLHQTINVWLDEGWDEETGTVLAETMTDAAIKAYERFPNKRLVVHYMQPHYPFVSSDTAFDKDHLNSIDVEGSTVEGENVWGQKFTGQLPVSDDKLWSMYVDNLEYVLEHVETVLDAIPGKAVVTSDHGNYVGERASPIPIREYGHPRGLYDDTVVHVPWLVHELGSRRETYLNKGEQSKANTDQELVAERLRALGYQE